MSKDDLRRLLPDVDSIRDKLEKNLKTQTLSVTAKNGMVTVVINYQQEITDLIIDNRLLDPGKAGALKANLVEVLNRAISTSRSKMLEETAKAVQLFK